MKHPYLTEKFRRGDKVWINPLPENMSHFYQKCHAIVIASYRDQYDVDSDLGDEYTLLILDKHNKPITESSWYPAEYLTKIGRVSESTLRELRLRLATA